MSESSRLKIMVSAYACEPNKGSEPGVGWHWVLQMAKYFELWVLTRRSNQKNIEIWLDQNKELEQLQYIHFNFYDLPRQLTLWKKKMRGVRLYYNIWQLGANKHITRIMKNNNISIFHLLTYGNALWPISRFGQKQFFIWGPTGGLDIIEPEYTRYYSYKSRFIEWIRRIAVRSLKLNYGFISRCKNVNLILCKTRYAINSIPIKYRDKAMICTDVAADIIPRYNQNERVNKTINYITVGKLDAWRGFDLVIEAFSRAYKKNSSIRLKIIGKGSEFSKISQIISEFKMEDFITMTGEISLEEYKIEMISCDVVINGCLKEGAVTNAFDCISYGKPLICVDTGGYTRYFTNGYAIVLPRVGRDELIDLLTLSILRLTEYEQRRILSLEIQTQAEKISWDTKGKEIKDIIMESITAHKSSVDFNKSNKGKITNERYRAG
jgi:glycosyltransferase involved in cell wall biosynthesis